MDSIICPWKDIKLCVVMVNNIHYSVYVQEQTLQKHVIHFEDNELLHFKAYNPLHNMLYNIVNDRQTVFQYNMQCTSKLKGC